MRIAFMLNSLGIGGTERQVVGLAGRMQARGHDVLMVVLRERVLEECPTCVDVLHLDLHKTRKAPASLFQGVRRAARRLRSFRPDILHCHNFHGNMLGRLLGMLLPSARVISTIHNVYEGGRLRMAAYRLTHALSDRTIAVCEAAADSAEERGAVPRGTYKVIANGIDVAEFAPNPVRRDALRLQMGVTDQFVWLAVGRIVAAKDYENLLHAFAELRETNRRVELWIAGEGSGVYPLRVQVHSAELGLRDSVRWLGLRRDVASLLDAADGFVLASAWEGMPLALGEAMVMEKPVVATDVGGVRELVGDCGTVVPAKNSGLLAAAMQNVVLAAGSASGEQTCRAARRRIEQFFSADANAEKWEQVYRSLLARE